MAVTSETLRLAAGLRRQVEAVTDTQTRNLVRAWVDAWDEVAPELSDAMLELTSAATNGQVTRAQVLRSVRVRKSLDVIAGHLTDLAEQTGVQVVGDLREVIDQAGRAQEAIIASQLPASERAVVHDWTRVDDGAIDAIVKRSTRQITATTRPISPDAYRVLRRELIRGVAVGDNPRETARRVVARAEGRFNGGLTRALTVARTETLDAHRAGALLSRQANADVLAGWQWLCDLGPRTCPACLAMNGSMHGVDETGPDGHQNCRCTAVPATRSWRDLGIDMDEPADVFPDAQAWFDGQAEDVQVAIMGRARLDLLQSGSIGWDDLAMRRTTAGWRDSIVPTPLSTLTARAAA